MTVAQDEAKDRLRRIAAEIVERIQPSEQSIAVPDGIDPLSPPLFHPDAAASPPSFHLVVDDARWLAAGIDALLSGEAKTLDHALGLVRPRGREAGLKKDRIAGVWAQSEKLTNDKLATKVHAKYNAAFKKSAPDEKTIRRAIGSTKDPAKWTIEARQAIADEVARRLAKNDLPASNDPDGHK